MCCVYISHSPQTQENEVVDVGRNTSAYSSNISIALDIGVTSSEVFDRSGLTFKFELNHLLKFSPLPTVDQPEPGQRDAEQRELHTEPQSPA